MWTSVGTGAVAGGVWAYGFVELRDIHRKLCGKTKCQSTDPPVMGLSMEGRTKLEKRGDKWQYITIGAGVTVGFAAVFAAIGAWQGYFSTDKVEEKQAGVVGKRKRREFTVTPVVSPDGGGATLRFDW